MPIPLTFRASLLCLSPLIALIVLTLTPSARADVGSGTAASCTEAALDLALAGGGAVTFNCGPEPVTIPITSTKTLTQVVHIDGGNLVSLQGNGSVRLFDLSGPVNYIMANLILRDGMALNGNGGAIRIETSTLLLSDVTLSGNTASGPYSRGGAIYSLSGAEVTLQRVTAEGNTAQYGGAIANDATDTLTLAEFIADGNSSVGDGGAVFHAGTTLAITQSLFTGNQSGTFGASGGAIVVAPNTTSTLSIANSTFHNNLRSGGGGNGSAISITGGVPAGSIVNSTFADNGGSPGTIAVTGNSQLTLRNTIVSNSMGQPNCAVFGVGGAAIVDDGNNLQWGGSVAQSCGANIPVADPLLAPLASNGGFSQTMALQAGSPAIDAASNCPPADQRGVARPIGTACDIGAFEDLATVDPPPSSQPAAVPTFSHAGLVLLSLALAGLGARRWRKMAY